MMIQNFLIRSLVIILAVVFVIAPIAVFAQAPYNRETLERQLIELNEIIQEEGKRNNVPLVEKSMDSLIDLMVQLGLPAEEITERVHLRIRYSLSENRLASASAAARSWLEKHPNDVVAQDMMGTIALRMKRTDEARKALRIVYQADPENLEKQLRYLNILNLLDDREEALRVCDGALKIHGNEPRVLSEAIQTYNRFNQSKEALELLSRLEVLTPNNPLLPYERGRALQELGDYEQAIQALSAIPRSDENWADAKQLTGICMTKLRRFDQAAQVFVEILSTYPYDTKTMSLLEQALARQRKQTGFKQVQEIRQNTEKILMPDIEAGYLWRKGDVAEHARLRSIALNQIGQFRDAETLFLEACKTVPESIAAQTNLAQFYITTHQACRAESIYRNLLNQVPASEKKPIVLGLAQSYLRQGKMDDAIQLQKKEANSSAILQSVQPMIGSSYLEILGDATQAISYLQTIQDPSPEVIAALARATLESGDCHKAWDYFERIPGDYDHLKTRLAKVECLARLEKKELANSLYQQIRDAYPNLSARMTIAAQAALADINRDENRDNLATAALEMKRTWHKIQTEVMEAHRLGWPKSVAALSELSDTYASMDERDIALQYAQLAYEGDPARNDIRLKMIDLLTAPDQLFRRLSQIRLAQSDKTIQRNFDKEIQESLAQIELASSK